MNFEEAKTPAMVVIKSLDDVINQLKGQNIKDVPALNQKIIEILKNYSEEQKHLDYFQNENEEMKA